jgi:DNA modification methylase
MPQESPSIAPNLAEEFFAAVHDRQPVNGWTHSFYRYPARFSPRFARAAIQCFSQPGDLILDPYMGGGTTVVEALAGGRRVVGNDLNPLAVFVAKVKTTRLTEAEEKAIGWWADTIIPDLSYRGTRIGVGQFVSDPRTRNLGLVRSRFIKKVVADALTSIEDLPTGAARAFARCVLLRVGQWALDGRKGHTPLREFRANLVGMTHLMLGALQDFTAYVQERNPYRESRSFLSQIDASEIDSLCAFHESGEKASLVVTSPPYPGVHVLYHRWQVDGRRETPAPYWITACQDGQGASFYNFGGRQEQGLHRYFESSLCTLRAIHRALRQDAIMVQMVAFGDPRNQLPRYLRNMELAGFSEIFPFGRRRNGHAMRLWRRVPGRKWHAAIHGSTNSSQEVVLIHRAR